MAVLAEPSSSDPTCTICKLRREVRMNPPCKSLISTNLEISLAQIAEKICQDKLALPRDTIHIQ
jgi:hypothetical protein